MMSRTDDAERGGRAVSAVTLDVPAQHLDLFALAIAWKVDWDAERIRETECELREALSRDSKLERLARQELRDRQGWLGFSVHLLATALDSTRREPEATIAFSAPAEELLASLEAMAREVIVPRLERLVDLGPIPTEAALELNVALVWTLEQVETMERAVAAERSATCDPAV
jgi:hypothetical protein